MLLRHIARPLLASSFIYDGVQAARKPSEHVAAARSGSALATKALGAEPLSEKQIATLVRAHGIATAAAGTMLALGKAPRASALTLALLTLPLAAVNQPFTAPRDDRPGRTGRFLHDLASVGAALIAGADLEGRPGLSWRVRQARTARAEAKAAAA